MVQSKRISISDNLNILFFTHVFFLSFIIKIHTAKLQSNMEKGEKAKNFFLKLKNSLLFFSVAGILHDEYSGSIYNSQRSEIFLPRGDCIPPTSHFTLWLFWHFLLFSLIIHYQHCTHTFVYLWIQRIILMVVQENSIVNGEKSFHHIINSHF